MEAVWCASLLAASRRSKTYNRTSSSNLAPVKGGNTRHTPEMHLRPPRVPPTNNLTDDAVVMFHCSEPLKKWCVAAVDCSVVHS